MLINGLAFGDGLRFALIFILITKRISYEFGKSMLATN